MDHPVGEVGVIYSNVPVTPKCIKMKNELHKECHGLPQMGGVTPYLPQNDGGSQELISILTLFIIAA